MTANPIDIDAAKAVIAGATRPHDMTQCHDADGGGIGCIYVVGHSGDHFTPTDGRDHSDEIRLRLVRDQRDRLQAMADLAPDAVAEVEALRAELQAAQAKADVIGGDWCKQNRAEGRGPCGACAVCCAELRSALAAALEAKDEACRIAKATAWQLHRECPNDADESDHPTTIKRIQQLSEVGK